MDKNEKIYDKVLVLLKEYEKDDEMLNFFYKTMFKDVFERVCNLLKEMKNKKISPKTLDDFKRLFKKFPELLTMQTEVKKVNEYFYGGKLNLGMLAAEYGLEEIVLLVLDNEKASVQQDCNGKNIGMYAAINGLERAVLKALDNEEASVQQDEKGMNIGMFAAKNGLEEATLKALDNKEASRQMCNTCYIDDDYFCWDFNIGLFAAFTGLEMATKKALKDPVARRERGRLGVDDDYGDIYTIRTLAEERGIKLDKIKGDSSDLIC